MDLQLNGKTALVTGASRGIGLAVAARIVAEGGLVCLTARKEDGLRTAVDELNGDGPVRAIGVAGKADDGFVALNNGDSAAALLDACAALRFWDRETSLV